MSRFVFRRQAAGGLRRPVVEAMESRRMLSVTVPTVLGGPGGPLVTNALDVTLGRADPHAVAFTDSNGAAHSVAITGPGTAILTFTGTGLAAAAPTKAGRDETVSGTGVYLVSLSVTGSTTGTSLLFDPATGRRRASAAPLVAFGDYFQSSPYTETGITTDGPLKALSGNVIIYGNVTVGGALGTLRVAGLAYPPGPTFPPGPPGGDVSTIPTPTPTAVVLADSIGSVVAPNGLAGNLNVSGSIGSVVARGSGLAGVRAGAGIGSITVRGDLSADISVGPVDGPATLHPTGSLGRLTVRGSLNNSLVLVAGAIGAVDVSGAIQDSRITLYNGNPAAVERIGSVTARSISRSEIGESTPAGDFTLPDAGAADFPPLATIGSVRTRGFDGSFLIADAIETARLGKVTPNNTRAPGTPFGVDAGTVGMISGSNPSAGKAFHFRRPTQANVSSLLAGAGLSAAGSDFALRIHGPYVISQ